MLHYSFDQDESKDGFWNRQYELSRMYELINELLHHAKIISPANDTKFADENKDNVKTPNIINMLLPVKKNIDKGLYNNGEECAVDVRKVFSECLKYRDTMLAKYFKNKFEICYQIIMASCPKNLHSILNGSTTESQKKLYKSICTMNQYQESQEDIGLDQKQYQYLSPSKKRKIFYLERGAKRYKDKVILSNDKIPQIITITDATSIDKIDERNCENLNEDPSTLPQNPDIEKKNTILSKTKSASDSNKTVYLDEEANSPIASKLSVAEKNYSIDPFATDEDESDWETVTQYQSNAFTSKAPNTTNKTGTNDFEAIVTQEDQKDSNEFCYFLLSFMKRIYFNSQVDDSRQRVACEKGFPGIGCKFCSCIDGRFFFKSYLSFCRYVKEKMLNHLYQCPRIPSDLRQKILEPINNNRKGVKRPMNIIYQRVWNRLHSDNGTFTVGGTIKQKMRSREILTKIRTVEQEESIKLSCNNHAVEDESDIEAYTYNDLSISGKLSTGTLDVEMNDYSEKEKSNGQSFSDIFKARIL